MVKPSGRDGRAGRENGAATAAGDGGVTAASKPSSPQRIQAVDRAIELLKAVAGAKQPQTAAELAKACGLNRTTAWRLLATLEDHGLVERDGAQRFGVGYGAVALGRSPSGSAALVRIARPALERLAAETGNTVTLSVSRREGILAIDQIDPPDATLVLNYLARPLPINATSTGKVLLASLSDEALDDVLVRPLERETAATVTDPERLREIVAEVHRVGYAVTVGELDVGINGISLGVFDEGERLVAILSVSDTEFRLPAERMSDCVPAMREAAAAIRRRLSELG
jgi:DNA-binding IclR family transcriptional regulator